KIGETPISAFEGVEYEIREGWSTDAALTLFTRTVTEDNLSIALEPFGSAGGYYPTDYGFLGDHYSFDPIGDTYGATVTSNTTGWAQRTTAANAVEFSVDVTFPQGLFTFNSKGGKDNTTVNLDVQYRAVGATTWIDAVWANSADTGFNSTGHINVTGAETSAVRRSGRVILPAAGQYEVRMRRTNTNTGGKAVDLTWWTALRTIKADYPVLQKNVALLALRIKASGQLNGVPQTINCEAQSYLPVWNGSTWTQTQTSNPAWAYADLLRRRGGETYIADDRIDLTTIKAWADACNATAPNASEPRWTFNAVLEGGSIYDNLKIIASNGRAAYTMKDGKHSVIRDIQQTVPVQHITPRNSHSYSGSKVFVDYPHCVRAIFYNKDNGFQQDERLVYYDGYSSTNATIFDTLDLQGCTSPTQAYREARYHMAVARLRPEEHTVQMDIEALRCTVGDLVRFQHDAVAIGINSTRVKDITTNVAGRVSAITLDDDVYFETGKTYVLRGRQITGASVLVSLTNPGTGYASTVYPATPPLPTACPDVGDLVLYGESSLESAPMIIKKIEPAEDFSVTVSLVDAQDGVYTADTGTIPAFNSYLTLPNMPTGGSLPPVYISTVRSDDSALIVNPDGSLTYRIFVQLQQPQGSTERVDYFEVQWQESNSTGWETVRIERGQPFAYLSPVVVGKSYRMRSRGMSDQGSTTDWSTSILHTVLGKNAPPGVPTAVASAAFSGGVRLTWTNPLDDDLWQTEIYENTTNNSATATLIDTVSASFYNRVGISSSDGLRYYWLKAVDTSGNKSAFSAGVSKTAANKALVVSLSNDSTSLAAAFDGTVASFSTAVGQVTVFDGEVDVTANAALTLSSSASNCTGSVNTATGSPTAAQPKGYYAVTAMTANQASLTITATYNSMTVTKVFTLAKSLTGANGSNGNSVVYIYQRAASMPTLPSVTTTYTFSTSTLTGLNNGWTTAIPGGTDPLYVSAATAQSGGTTDTIAAGEWATPVVFVQNGTNGSNGTNGFNTATVYLFQRTTTATPPSVPSATVTYTFATGAATGLTNGWAQSLPTTGGAYRWVTTATALSTSTTDTLATGEWATSALLAQDGADGAAGSAGLNNAVIYLYQRAASAPAVPSTTSTYTFATSALTGYNNGWSTTIPAGTSPLYVTAASASSTGATDTIAPAEWASPVIFVQNGTDGTNGTNGTNGVNTATVYLFQRTTTNVAPTLPSAAITYTFSTASAAGITNGWAQSLPATGGSYRWVTTATALSSGTTDTIAAGEWAAASVLAQDGDPGAAAQILFLSSTGQSFTFDGLAAAKPTSQTITLTANQQNLTGTATFVCTLYNSSGGSLGAVTLGGTGNTRTLTVAQFSTAAYAIITATNGSFSDTITVYRLVDGSSALTAFLTNEAITLTANSAGVVSDYSTATGTFKVFRGATDITTSCTFPAGSQAATNINFSIVASGATAGQFAVSFSNPSGGIGYLRALTPEGVTLEKILTVSISAQGSTGSPGAAAQLLFLSCTGQSFTFDGTNAAKPTSQTITLTANQQNITGTATFACTLYNSAGTSLGAVTLGGTGNTRTLTVAQFSTASYAVITATNGSLSDTVTVVRLVDGSSTVTGYLTNEAVTLTGNAAGAVTDFSAATGTLKMFRGTTDITSLCTFARGGDSNVTSTMVAGPGATAGNYSVTAVGAAGGYAILVGATAQSEIITKIFTVSVAKQGNDGAAGVSPVSISLSPSARAVLCTYLGEPKSGQIPAYLNVTVAQAGTTVTGTASITITPTGCTASYSGGLVTVTAMSGDTATILVQATYAGQTVFQKATLSKTYDSPPKTTASTLFDQNSTNSTASFTTTGPTVTLTAPTTGSVILNVYSGWQATFGSTFNFQAKLQYRVVAGTWADVSGSLITGNPSFYNSADLIQEPGDLNIGPLTLGGLTSGVTYEFQYLTRKSSGTGSLAYATGLLQADQA
ncbi:Tip attachment protein J, partial [uncultured Caudovirales phage]